ncbi:MAG TPA: DUF3443 family protein [Candidatus Saccharimonadales bacterium]|nr:DUF3443 family protein [Candidatus Saccharimonadales bacterium]
MRRTLCALSAGITCALLLLGLACGGGSSASKASTGGGTTPTIPGTPTATGTVNTVPISVNAGPSTKFAYTNGVFVSVTICKPGTSTCATVPDVLLDTGSTGLRLLSSTVTAAGLTNVSLGGTTTLTNCVQYLDNSYNWGPVALADIQMGGEIAKSVPIQVIAQPGDTFPAAPATCGGTANNTTDTLLANGILGVSFFLQDCGAACAPGTTFNGGSYYACNSTTCQQTTAPLAQQLQNPVSMFATDNNGLAITLSSIPDVGAVSTSGTLQFGIATQSDNALGSAVVLTPDNSGNFMTTLGSTSTNVAFIDSGSSALFFLSSATTGLAECTGANVSGFYCPATPQTLTATNKGKNGTLSKVTFSVTEADTLLNSNNDVFSNLAGTGTDPQIGPYFDWGLPFFLGRKVFVAFDGASAGGTAGPFWAY